MFAGYLILNASIDVPEDNNLFVGTSCNIYKTCIYIKKYRSVEKHLV